MKVGMRCGKLSLIIAATVLSTMGSDALAHRLSDSSGPPAPASAFSLPAPYKTRHAEEDFSYLIDSSMQTDSFDPIKYIPLAGRADWFLTFGGEARLRYEYFNNRNFGDAAQDPNGYLLQRYMFFGDVHIGSHVRLFTEFKSAFINFEQSTPRSTDENHLELHQAFVDLTVDPTPKMTLPVRTRPGVFDDATDAKTHFWGLHAVKALSAASKGGINAYYFGLNQEGVDRNQLAGREQRHTVGARLFDRVGSWDYDIEGTFQWGSFGTGDIQAWRIAFDGGFHMTSLPFHPRPHFQIDVMSGDRRQGDQNIESFNPLYPKAHYFGLIGLLGPVNLINMHPSIDFQLTEKLRATTKVDFFWRQSINDGVYNGAGEQFLSPGASKATYVGSEVQAEIAWELSRHMLLIANYTHFFAGKFVRDSGSGKDIDYTTTWVTYRF
jgi:Alginate export